MRDGDRLACVRGEVESTPRISAGTAVFPGTAANQSAVCKVQCRERRNMAENLRRPHMPACNIRTAWFLLQNAITRLRDGCVALPGSMKRADK
ncbi:MAG TPA: hypothetical protein VF928_04055 [Usitatibacteraceae bacterium]